MTGIQTSDKTLVLALNSEIAKAKGLDSALVEWQKAYDTIGSGDQKAVSKLYSTTAELAAQFKNYKQGVDRILQESKSTTVQGIRTDYLETLDGFIANISNGILIGQKLLT